MLIEGTGAYTATYSSVAFNGFAPLKAYHIWAEDREAASLPPLPPFRLTVPVRALASARAPEGTG